MSRLHGWRPAVPPDPAWLRELPSRMLDPRYAVVPFTGREQELSDLVGWRTDGNRLAARWLHGPAGVGKTRLAARFAAESAAAGWKVVTADPGPDAGPPPGNDDLRLGRARGVLLLVDPAGDWPTTRLGSLFADAILHRVAVPTRVLLLARDTDGWPAVRVALDEHEADASAQEVLPLPAAAPTRTQMFHAARDGFAHRYRLDQPPTLSPPVPLDDPDFGLVLVVHMAALVAVDAYATGCRAPDDLDGLTGYLLDRERAQDGGPDLLAGPTSRFAEDLLALTVSTDGADGPLAAVARDARPAQAARCITALSRASQRWPHLGHGHLYPLLRQRPELAVTAGSPAICALAATGHIDPDTLAAVEAALPEHPAADLHPGAAALSLRLTPLRLADTDDPAQQARLLHEHSVRLCLAGSLAQSAVAAQDAVTRLRDLAELDPDQLPVLGAALWQLATCRSRLREHDLALAPAEEAVRLLRGFADVDPASHLPALGAVLAIVSDELSALERHDRCLAAAEEAVAVGRRLAAADPDAYRPFLATALLRLGGRLSRTGPATPAQPVYDEATALLRELAATAPETYRSDLATAVHRLAACLSGLGQHVAALPHAEEAVTRLRELAVHNPARHLPHLADALDVLGTVSAAIGRAEDAIDRAEECAAILRRLADGQPDAHLPRLARVLDATGVRLAAADRPQQGVGPVREATAILRRLAHRDADRYLPDLALTLHHLGRLLAEAGSPREAVEATREAATFLRRLAHRDPDRYLPDLALALDHMGGWLGRLRRRDEALTAAREAAVIRCQLVQTDQDGHLADLAVSLHHLGVRLHELGRFEQALEQAQQAVAIQRQLARERPDRYLRPLARSLCSLALIQAGGPADLTGAMDAAQEAIDICHGSPAGDPDQVDDELALAYHAYAAVLDALGNRSAARVVRRRLERL